MLPFSSAMETVRTNINFAAIVSGCIILFLIILTRVIIRQSKLGYGFLDIIRDHEGWPSLSNFQFLVWTIVVLFSYLTIYLVRITSGCYDPIGSLSPRILILMGISVATPLASGFVSGIKYAPSSHEAKDETKNPDKSEQIRKIAAEDIKKKRFSSMLMERNRPTLTRFQMFSWTWIGVLVYLSMVLNVIYTFEDPSMLTLPDVDQTLLVLMGISQGVYLGGKILTPTSLEITHIKPSKGKIEDEVILIGYDFTEFQNMVFFNDKKIPDTDILAWGSTSIRFNVPKDAVEGTASVSVKVESRLSNIVQFKVE